VTGSDGAIVKCNYELGVKVVSKSNMWSSTRQEWQNTWQYIKKCHRGTWNSSSSVRGRYLYLLDKHERRVLCKLQRGLTAVNSWCERWNIKINVRNLRRSISSEDLESLTIYYNWMDETFSL
jgi:hypothetical protein